jgi:hypothetical protein
MGPRQTSTSRPGDGGPAVGLEPGSGTGSGGTTVVGRSTDGRDGVGSPPPGTGRLGTPLGTAPPGEPPVPPGAPEPVAPEPVAAPPRTWNVWELERRARERAGRDVAKDEEWHFLLVYLREFADPDGNLPSDFDGLVRESFSELLG